MKTTDIPRVPTTSKAALRKLTRMLDQLPDPRTARVPLHSLTNILAIALCAVVSDCDSWEQIADFGRDYQSWFKTFLDLPLGIPSSDTFRRVLGRMNPRAFQAILVEYVESLRLPDPDGKGPDDRHVAIDGKTLRSSFEHAAERSPLHLVQAMSTKTGMVLAQAPTTVTDDEEVKKGNEITAIPKLLELFDVKGTTITIDAIGCQKSIAKKIVEGGGHYLLALKDNHPKLATEVDELFVELHSKPLPATARRLRAQNSKGHGREEERYDSAMPAPKSLPGHAEWAGLKSLVQVTTAASGRKTTIDTRYYLSTLPVNELPKAARCIRHHWRIESMHWVLDMTFGEDDSRIHQGHGAENYATLRRVALALLKIYQNKPRADGKKKKPSLRRLRKIAGRDMAALASIVTQRT